MRLRCIEKEESVMSLNVDMEKWEKLFQWIKGVSNMNLGWNTPEYICPEASPSHVMRMTEGKEKADILIEARERGIPTIGTYVSYPKVLKDYPKEYVKYNGEKEYKRYLKHIRDDFNDMDTCYAVEIHEYVDDFSSETCFVYSVEKRYHNSLYDTRTSQGVALVGLSPWPYESTKQWEKSIKFHEHDYVFRKYDEAVNFVRMWSILQKCSMDESLENIQKGRKLVSVDGGSNGVCEANAPQKKDWWKAHRFILPRTAASIDGIETLFGAEDCEKDGNVFRYNERPFMNESSFECFPKEMYYVNKEYCAANDLKIIARYSIDRINAINVIRNVVFSGCTNNDEREKRLIFNRDMVFKTYDSALACCKSCMKAQMDACRMSLDSSISKKGM